MPQEESLHFHSENKILHHPKCACQSTLQKNDMVPIPKILQLSLRHETTKPVIKTDLLGGNKIG